jgi:hypothetical protein
VKYGIRVKINIAMSNSIEDFKNQYSSFRHYLNEEKDYASPASLGLVDARMIGVFLNTEPQLTFQKNLKDAIMETMNDQIKISLFPKSIKEPTFDGSKEHFANGLVLQSTAPDAKPASDHTTKLTKAMDFFMTMAITT